MMLTDPERIARLEWANYAAQLPAIQATLGINLRMEDRLITITSLFPSPDVNHACLMQTTPDRANDLISAMIARFKWKPARPRIFVSSACSPPDLVERLLARGFVEMEAEREAWVAINLLDIEIPPPAPDVLINQVTKNETLSFARIFVTAFGMPIYFTPFMSFLLRPSIELPGSYHYLAYVNGRPVGTCSLLCYEDIGIIGSGGVLPARRGSRVARSLVITVASKAQEQGMRILVGQTANRRVERALRMGGFELAFNRACYALL